MTQQRKLDSAAEAPSEEEISAYLAKHPDFFERHGKTLLRLRLPHATTGATVSLVERQIAMLRQKNDQLQRNMKDLVSVAKHNDALVQKLHQLSINFLSAQTRAERIEQLETALREEFAAQRAALVLFTSNEDRAADISAGFVIHAQAEDEALQPFSTFLKSGKTRCGPLREKQKQYLFGDDNEALGSAAMVPLGARGASGFLVIGNRNRDYFNPTERTDLLSRLGELVSIALANGRSASD